MDAGSEMGSKEPSTLIDTTMPLNITDLPLEIIEYVLRLLDALDIPTLIKMRKEIPALKDAIDFHKNVAGINARRKNGETWLIGAARNDDISAVEWLSSRKGVDFNAVDGLGLTALHYACLNGNDKMVSLLLEEEIFNGEAYVYREKDEVDPDIGVNIKAIFIDKKLGVKIGQYIHIEIDGLVQKWYKQVSDIIQINRGFFYSFAQVPTRSAPDGDGFEVIERRPIRSFPLSPAPQSAQALIFAYRKNINVNAKDGHGETPLHIASFKGYEKVVRMLLDNDPKADVNAEDNNSKTPLHMASQWGHEKVVQMLLDKGADVDAPNDNGWTPLHFASRNGHEQVVRVLLDKGADVNAKNNDGWTPLHSASENGHEKVVRMLLNNDPKADANAKNNDGKTPRDLAESKGHKDVVRMLLGKSADVNAKDNDG